MKHGAVQRSNNDFIVKNSANRTIHEEEEEEKQNIHNLLLGEEMESKVSLFTLSKTNYLEQVLMLTATKTNKSRR